MGSSQLRDMERSQEYLENEKDKLEESDPTVLSKWLTLYAAETRKQDGTRYPPKMLYLLLIGLLHHMHTLNPVCSNFLDDIVLLCVHEQ